MAYNTKQIKKDIDNSPIPQYYNPDTDEYEPLQGQAGASKAILQNSNGEEIPINAETFTTPIVEKLDQLTGTVVDEETRKANETQRKAAEIQRQNLYLEVQQKLDNGEFVGATGPKGDKGDTGAGIKVLGVLDFEADLPTTAQQGDAYIIQNVLWVYTAQSQWKQAGAINNEAKLIPIEDAGENFQADNVEDALQEVIGKSIEIIPLGEDISPSERKSKLYLKVTDKQTKEIYGVRHWFNASNTALERLYDSIGFEVNVGIDGAVVRNDFDNVYPFNQIKTVNVDENLNITAYEGDSNFTRDGSNGDVMVMFPKFYVKDIFTDTYRDELISKYKLPGFYCPQKFINEDGTEKDYGLLSAYEGSLSEDGTKLRSVSGAFPAVSLTRNAFTQRAMAKGAGWTIEDIATRDIEERLVNIVFADLNVQNLVQGCVNLPISNNITAVVAENGVNRIIVSNSNASGFIVGQTIAIGTASYDSSAVANNRIITSITDYDTDNKAIDFDGDPVDIAVGNVVSSRAWKTGMADDCKASISVYTANNGKYPFKFYGIENIWGHLWKFIQGVNIRDHQVWVCADPTQYADDKFEEPYKQLSYICPAENGYVKEMGYDARYPFAKFPITVGGSSAVYYADYYYQSVGDRVAYVGGRFDDGVCAGLRAWNVYAGSGNAGFTISARLSA